LIIRNFEYLLALNKERHFARAAAACRADADADSDPRPAASAAAGSDPALVAAGPTEVALAADDVHPPAADIVRVRVVVHLVGGGRSEQVLDFALALDEGGDDLGVEVRG